MNKKTILLGLITILALISSCAFQKQDSLQEDSTQKEPPEVISEEEEFVPEEELTYEEHLNLLTPEEYCAEFTEENCPSDKCKVGPSCPICADIGCRPKDYDKDWPTQEELISG